MRWPINKEQHAYMKMRQKQNILLSKNSKAESWMFTKLKKTPFKWKRQAQWGYRIFDFWSYTLGIAIEVDGKEHKPDYDNFRDNANYIKSGIKVIRVRNFNEEDANKAIDYILNSENWNDRRIALSLKPISGVPIKLENHLLNNYRGADNPTPKGA